MLIRLTILWMTYVVIQIRLTNRFLPPGKNWTSSECLFSHPLLLPYMLVNLKKPRLLNTDKSSYKLLETSVTSHPVPHNPSFLLARKSAAVLNRLTHAIRFGDVRIEQQIPDLDDECRPDVVIQ